MNRRRLGIDTTQIAIALVATASLALFAACGSAPQSRRDQQRARATAPTEAFTPPTAARKAQTETAANSSPASAIERGKAVWYGGKWHGRKTASGETFNQNALTAAHKTLPFQTKVKVTNLANGKSVIVRITDRGPYGAGRIIDLSKAAAKVVGMIDSGVTDVTIEIVERAPPKPARKRRKQRR